MKFAVTGSAGFLGWHTRCALKARGDDFVAIDRGTDDDHLAAALTGADAVLHLAGVNRAEPDVLRHENLCIARRLTDALDAVHGRPTIVYANSIQSGNASPFGDGKLAAADHLALWGGTTGAAVVDVHLPNLFGEYGRPGYNSVVATFSHELATGGKPTIVQDREIPLLHVQDAVDQMLILAEKPESSVVSPVGRVTSVSSVLAMLTEFRDLYATGDIPDIADPFRLAMFNTYRSFCFPGQYPMHPQLRADNRGYLFECVRSRGGQGHVFLSTSHPEVTRGEHFHLRKVERFVVVEGQAEIRLRRLFDDAVVRFAVSGDEPAMVDMPTMWAHSITNTGNAELMTLFWANEILDPSHPDTFAEPVEQKVAYV